MGLRVTVVAVGINDFSASSLSIGKPQRREQPRVPDREPEACRLIRIVDREKVNWGLAPSLDREPFRPATQKGADVVDPVGQENRIDGSTRGLDQVSQVPITVDAGVPRNAEVPGAASNEIGPTAALRHQGRFGRAAPEGDCGCFENFGAAADRAVLIRRNPHLSSAGVEVSSGNRCPARRPVQPKIGISERFESVGVVPASLMTNSPTKRKRTAETMPRSIRATSRLTTADRPVVTIAIGILSARHESTLASVASPLLRAALSAGLRLRRYDARK